MNHDTLKFYKWDRKKETGGETTKTLTCYDSYIPLKWKGSVEGGNGMSDWKQNIVKCYPLGCDFI